MRAEQCIFCREQPVRGVLCCTSPHWLAAGDIRWRTVDGTARVVVEETCVTCENSEKRKPAKRIK